MRAEVPGDDYIWRRVRGFSRSNPCIFMPGWLLYDFRAWMSLTLETIQEGPNQGSPLLADVR